MSELLSQIEQFIGIPSRDNKWFHDPNIDIYLRKTKRIVDGQFLQTLDIANISVHDTGIGFFTELLGQIEEFCKDSPIENIFIENVMTDRFCHFFVKRGYTEKEDGSIDRSFCLKMP